MSQEYKTATVFGGTGFIGRQIVRELGKRGWVVKVATRVPERAYFLRPHGVVGQIVPFHCDYSDSKSIAKAVEGADAVINCIGILYERKRGDFTRMHTDLPGDIAKAASKAGVERLVHLSAAGVEECRSKYGHSKTEGDKAVRKAFPTATILRPSIVFGPDDDFFNKFAELSRFLPMLPLIGGGHTRFQPVFVGDVADAAMAAIERPAVGKDNPQGRIYGLGGSEILSFEELYLRLFKYTGRVRALVRLPFWVAKIEATFLNLLPGPPLLTRDQVEALKTDSIADEEDFHLEDLGVSPTGLDSILPSYLSMYRSGGRFGDLKEA